MGVASIAVMLDRKNRKTADLEQLLWCQAANLRVNTLGTKHFAYRVERRIARPFVSDAAEVLVCESDAVRLQDEATRDAATKAALRRATGRVLIGLAAAYPYTQGKNRNRREPNCNVAI